MFGGHFESSCCPWQQEFYFLLLWDSFLWSFISPLFSISFNCCPWQQVSSNLLHYTDLCDLLGYHNFGLISIVCNRRSHIQFLGQKLIYWYGSMVVGLIIRHLYLRKLIFYNFSEIFKTWFQVDWIESIWLHLFCLTLQYLDNSVICRKYIWIIFDRSIFSFYYV